MCRGEGWAAVSRRPHSVCTAVRSFCSSPAHKENPALHSLCSGPLGRLVPPPLCPLCLPSQQCLGMPQTQKGFTGKPVAQPKCVQSGRKHAMEGGGGQGWSRAGSGFGFELTRESDGPAQHRDIMMWFKRTRDRSHNEEAHLNGRWHTVSSAWLGPGRKDCAKGGFAYVPR